MKLLRAAILDFIYFLTFPFVAFAHETEVVHEEPVPTISPIVLVGIVVVLVIAGFLLWKFVLNKKEPTPLVSKTEPPFSTTTTSPSSNKESTSVKTE